MLSRTVLASGLAIVLAGGGAAYAQPTGPGEETVKKQFTAAVRAVDVDISGGAVTVVSGTATSLEARLEWMVERPRLTAEVSGGVLKVRVDCNDRVAAGGVSFSLSNFCTADLRLVVPRAVSLTAVTGNGPISVSALSGSQDLRSSSGGIRVTDVRGERVSARSGNGAIAAQRVNAATLALSTASGGVSATTATVRTLTARSGNGAVTLTSVNASGAITATTSADRISVQNVRSAALTLETGNGDVAATGVTTRTIRAATSSGAVTVRRLSAHSLAVETGNGTIALSELRTRRVSAETSSGPISAASLTAPDLLTATTGNGKIDLRVPRGRYAVEARSGNGEVRIDDITPDRKAARRITARTSSGNVTITGSG